jgi:hypothetical protein
MERVSKEVLARALRNTLGTKGLPEEAITCLAEYLLEFFGFNEVISDSMLTASDRDIFYMLEDEGILSTDMDEVPVKHGKRWQIHYWKLKVETILALAELEEGEEKQDESNIYDNEELWEREEK